MKTISVILLLGLCLLMWTGPPETEALDILNTLLGIGGEAGAGSRSVSVSAADSSAEVENPSKDKTNTCIPNGEKCGGNTATVRKCCNVCIPNVRACGDEVKSKK